MKLILRDQPLLLLQATSSLGWPTDFNGAVTFAAFSCFSILRSYIPGGAY